jgi:hypothetical protein
VKASSQSSTPPATWQGQGGAVVYYYVDDIKSTLQTLVDAGAEVDTDVQDVGGAGRSPPSRTRTATSSGCCRTPRGVTRGSGGGYGLLRPGAVLRRIRHTSRRR